MKKTIQNFLHTNIIFDDQYRTLILAHGNILRSDSQLTVLFQSCTEF
jgi:hypothetical protein